MLVHFIVDERYPDYEEISGFEYAEVTVDMSKEEYRDMNRVFKEYNEWQLKIQELHDEDT